MSAETLISQAIEKGASVETLEKLLAVRRELKAEWARDEFFKALAKFQSECPVVDKSEGVYNKPEKGGALRYKFAPLDKIVEQVKDLIKANGFSYLIKPTENKDGWVGVLCVVHHVAGHSEETRFEVPIDKDAYMTAPQKVAAALTFTKRYAFQNAFGILTGDDDNDCQDDDSPAAKKPAPAQKPAASKPPAAKPAGPIDYFDRVNRFVGKALMDNFISPAMADLYRKEAGEHRADIDHLKGMCTRIVAQVEAAKGKATAALNKTADEAWPKADLSNI